MKKILALLAATMMLCSNVIAGNISEPCNIKEPVASPNNVAISYCDGSLDITDGVAECYGMVKTRIDYKAEETVELQQYNSGWKTIKSWTETSSNSSATVYESKSVTKGYSYRVKTISRAIDSSGDVVESITKYTSTHSY